MKSKIIVLMIVLLLVGANVYAANGDLTVNGNLTVNSKVTVGTPGITFFDGSVQNTAKRLVCDILVTAATTDVSCPGLDGNAHGGYTFEVVWVPVGSPGTAIALYVENDILYTNYYSQYITQNNTSITGARVNNSSLLYTDGSTRSVAVGTIFTAGNGEFFAISNSIRNPASTFIKDDVYIKKMAPISNITQLKFSSSVSTNIGIGSRFRLWKMN